MKDYLKFFFAISVFYLIICSCDSGSKKTENNSPRKTETTEEMTQTESSNQVKVTEGKYPEASDKIITDSVLYDLSSEELKIMRNEIFARHGFIFKPGSVNDYFNKQSWYTPKLSNVETLLTNIEKDNIKKIKNWESDLLEASEDEGDEPVESTQSNSGIYGTYRWFNPVLEKYDGEFTLNSDKTCSSYSRMTGYKEGVFTTSSNGIVNIYWDNGFSFSVKIIKNGSFYILKTGSTEYEKTN